ncbi:thiol reductant ABC exporter subunit CydD [Pseudohoeflea suaedae]|uniref:Thiol reductant ABC exporter subunit CydD n=2 Tax=Pseudohoeflea suaedae TaxID=877384 RepID=A0A4R5PQV8_9HYPH|nr:thiol reductant ABC exporter subunit CydD [Pseudohoeflea suaedae]
MTDDVTDPGTTQTSEDRARLRLNLMSAPEATRLRRAEWLTVIASLLWIGQAAAAAMVIDDLVSGQPDVTNALYGSSVFVLLGVLRAALSHRSGSITLAAAQAVISRERNRLLAREALRSPFSEGGRSSAEIAALTADKLAMTIPYLTRYRPAMARARIVPAAILLVALPFSWIAAFILLIAGPLIPVFMALVGMAAQDASERQMKEIGSMNGLLMERIRALTDLRLIDATDRTIRDFRRSAERLHRRTMKVLAVAFLSSTVLEFFSAIGVALMAVYVGFSLIGQINFGAWAKPLGVGEGVFLLLLAPDFFQPLRDLAAAWHDKAQAAAVAVELDAVETAPFEPMLGKGSAATLPAPPQLATRSLRWITPSGQTISYPDFDLAAGQSLAVVGPSGTGKSSLLALIAGLTPAETGAVFVGDGTLDDDTADGWRRHIALIPQSPHFAHESLRANLRRFAAEASDAGLRAALNAASASDILARLPRGLDTRLGETGHGVSGGEARRLMIARAFCSSAAIILADEPTADLDAETAHAVTEGLLALKMRGASLIVATHDLALAARMDRRIVLGDGT